MDIVFFVCCITKINKSFRRLCSGKFVVSLFTTRWSCELLFSLVCPKIHRMTFHLDLPIAANGFSFCFEAFIVYFFFFFFCQTELISL